MAESESQNNVVISKKTINRIISDISELIKNPLHEHNIFYEHDEDNILAGYAMIVGPKDTPYYGGYYFFYFRFPHNYPHSPPKVTYYTNDGMTRFNPNLYKCGKVCLSVLNTWRGEGWTGCQTISSILLILCSILNENPLLNEPGITEKHADLKNYNKIIHFKNYQVALIRMLNKDGLDNKFSIFYDEMVKIYLKNYENYVEDIKAKDCNKNAGYTATSMYGMSVKIDYEEIIENMNLLYNFLIK
jgi:ubiquitin-protein ligase